MVEIAAALSLDSYAAYVWAAYGVTGVGIAVMVLACLVERRRVRRRLAATAGPGHTDATSGTEAP